MLINSGRTGKSSSGRGTSNDILWPGESLCIQHERHCSIFLTRPLSGRFVCQSRHRQENDEFVPIDDGGFTLLLVHDLIQKSLCYQSVRDTQALISPTQNIRDIPFVVIVGGSALDFKYLSTDRSPLSSAIVAGQVMCVAVGPQCSSDRTDFDLCQENGGPTMDLAQKTHH